MEVTLNFNMGVENIDLLMWGLNSFWGVPKSIVHLDMLSLPWHFTIKNSTIILKILIMNKYIMREINVSHNLIYS